MNAKMSNQEIMVKEKKLNESWRQSKRQQQPIKRPQAYPKRNGSLIGEKELAAVMWLRCWGYRPGGRPVTSTTTS